MLSARKQILASLFATFEQAAKEFRKDRTGLRFSAVQSVMLAMQCADAQPESVLQSIIETTRPEDYAKVLCTPRVEVSRHAHAH